MTTETTSSPLPVVAMPHVVTCYGQVGNGLWCQEWYETSTRDAGRRAAQLRKLGYQVSVSAMGSQVTSVGRVKMTLVDIRPGRHEDVCELPAVKVERA